MAELHHFQHLPGSCPGIQSWRIGWKHLVFSVISVTFPAFPGKKRVTVNWAMSWGFQNIFYLFCTPNIGREINVLVKSFSILDFLILTPQFKNFQFWPPKKGSLSIFFGFWQKKSSLFWAPHIIRNSEKFFFGEKNEKMGLPSHFFEGGWTEISKISDFDKKKYFFALLKFH